MVGKKGSSFRHAAGMYPHHSNAVGTQLQRIASNGLSVPEPQSWLPKVVQLPSPPSSEGLESQPPLLVLPSASLTHCITMPTAGQTPCGRTFAVEHSAADATGAQPPKPCCGPQ